MGTASASLSHHPVRFLTLLGSDFRLLLRRHWWELFGGLGLILVEMERSSGVPGFWAPVVWFVILSVAVGLVAARHREA